MGYEFRDWFGVRLMEIEVFVFRVRVGFRLRVSG